MVLIRQSVIDEIRSHGLSSPSVEVCGVLAGRLRQSEAGEEACVTVAVRGKGAIGHAGSVTFTADTWQHIQSVLDRDHPDLRIVGWYHTHPDFGIFLSEMDLFIHSQFFNLPWQIALVYDPIREEQGLFTWQQGRALPGEFVIEDDLKKPEPPIRSASASLDPVRQLNRRLTAIVLAWVALIAAALIWLTVTPSWRGS
ncbi:MAG: Mov34/MPN/PAD-1 family protein [Phycisphaeraceae bacterium]|nr:Mov34/MPN/PAD-1 family protein [Phycisphaeraceae bacterium]